MVGEYQTHIRAKADVKPRQSILTIMPGGFQYLPKITAIILMFWPD